MTANSSPSSMTDEILAQLSLPDLAARLGTDEATAREAAETALPTLLAGFTNQAVDPARSSGLARAVREDHDASVLAQDDPVAHVDPADGDRIVQHVFGDRRDDVEQRLQAASSKGQGSLMSALLPLLAPLVMAWLSKKVMGGGGAAGGSGGGGLGDILGDVLGGGSGGGASSGGAGGGGLGDILGDVLGGGAASSDGAGGGGLGDILGEVLGGGSDGDAGDPDGGGGLGGMLGEVLGGSTGTGGTPPSSADAPASSGRTSGGGLGDVLGQLGGKAGGDGGLDDLLGSILGGGLSGGR